MFICTYEIRFKTRMSHNIVLIGSTKKEIETKLKINPIAININITFVFIEFDIFLWTIVYLNFMQF